MKVLVISTYNSYTGANQSLVGFVECLKDKVGFLVINTSQSMLNEKLDELNVRNVNIKTYQDIIKKEHKTYISSKVKISIKKIINFCKEIKIAYLIKKESIDIVHINSGASSVGYLAAKLTNTPIIWHLREFVLEDHGNLFWDEKKRVKQLNDTDCLIAVSNSVKEKYKGINVSNDISVIYNGVNPKPLYSINDDILSKPVVTMTIAGSLMESKGQKQAILALKELQEKGYGEFRLQIFGNTTGAYYEGLKEITDKLPNPQAVQFLGFESEVEKIWENTDIALICSKNEAFGRVTVEAMLTGSLVIGANTAGTRELINHNVTGLLYESGNITSLTSQIIEAYKNKEKSRIISSNGKIDALNKYNISNTANNIYNKYMNVYGNEE